MGKTRKNVRNIVTILNINIDSTPADQLLSKIEVRLRSGRAEKPLIITTPNAEHIVISQRDSAFKKILNSSDIAIPDAVGVVAAQKFCSFNRPQGIFKFWVLLWHGALVGFEMLAKAGTKPSFTAIKGRQFFLDLIKLADTKGLSVYLMGGETGVSQKTQEKLEKQFINVKFNNKTGPIVSSKGVPINLKEKLIEKDMLEEIKRLKPDILFVALGAPKQEKWVARLKNQLHVKVVMVVGGTFDYVSGKSKLPPKFLSGSFEWLWRLITEPYRYKRIFAAVVVFPLLVFKSRYFLSTDK